MFGAEFGNEALKSLVGELGTIVCDERLRDSKPSKHVSFVKTQDVVRGNFREDFGLYPFCEVIYGHYEEFVLVRPLYEWPEDVSIPHQANGHGGDSVFSSCGGARCMSACLWHLSHFSTWSLASCCIVGQ